MFLGTYHIKITLGKYIDRDVVPRTFSNDLLDYIHQGYYNLIASALFVYITVRPLRRCTEIFIHRDRSVMYTAHFF